MDLLLKATASFSDTLRIVGRGDDEEKLKGMAQHLGMADRIHWVPWMSPDELKGAIERANWWFCRLARELWKCDG